jgi:TRAP-type C4-dicarboxylate transport system substrate-binding protein
MRICALKARRENALNLFSRRQPYCRRFMRERWKDLEEQSRRQAEAAGVTIVSDFDRKPFEAAMADIYDKARRDPAAVLLERIRTVN